MTLQGKKIIVVGATGVLGSLLATSFAQQGADLILTTSSQSKLSSLGAAGRLLDLADPDSINQFANHFAGVAIDGLVIAAGAVAFGPASDVPAEITDKLMQVNATGPIQLVNALAQSLALAETSFVLTLSGKVAEIPTAGIAAYSASKSALFAYSVAAGRELRRNGVRWIDARPGHTETGFADRAAFGSSPAFPQGYEPSRVAARLLTAILEGEKDLPSSAFD